MSTIQPISYLISVKDVLLWQYNQATNITSLINYKQDWLDEFYSTFWDSWYNNVFWLWNDQPEGDPLSVTVFGESVWAIILGIELEIPDEVIEPYIPFGFENYNNFNDPTGPDPTNGAPFSNLNFFVPSRDLRLLILRLRYFQLTTRGDIPSINAFIAKAFALYPFYSGEIYALDNYDMTMTYVLTATPPYELIYALTHFDILPRPAGVKLIFSTP